jgi:hypothetical protein
MKSPDHASECVSPSGGWILYNGGCGFCFRWVHFSQENLLDDIRVLTRAGKLGSGTNAYLYVAR